MTSPLARDPAPLAAGCRAVDSARCAADAEPPAGDRDALRRWHDDLRARQYRADAENRRLPRIALLRQALSGYGDEQALADYACLLTSEVEHWQAQDDTERALPAPVREACRSALAAITAALAIEQHDLPACTTAVRALALYGQTRMPAGGPRRRPTRLLRPGSASRPEGLRVRRPEADGGDWPRGSASGRR